MLNLLEIAISHFDEETCSTFSYFFYFCIRHFNIGDPATFNRLIKHVIMMMTIIIILVVVVLLLLLYKIIIF